MIAAPPASEAELLSRAEALAGRSLAELAAAAGQPVPDDLRRAKGWAGQLVEAHLGATAGSLSEPDFQLIGVELKTLPVDAAGRPRESTYVCTVPLEPAAAPVWETSCVCDKLRRVLWVPVEAEPGLLPAERRVGWPLLWSPSDGEERALRADWEELMDRVCLGELESVTAHDGTVLQIRPKAASSRSRRWGVGATGERVRTLPRGFYLRAGFTASILAAHYATG